MESVLVYSCEDEYKIWPVFFPTRNFQLKSNTMAILMSLKWSLHPYYNSVLQSECEVGLLQKNSHAEIQGKHDQKHLGFKQAPIKRFIFLVNIDLQSLNGESFLQCNNYSENNCLYLVTASECQKRYIFLTIRLFVTWGKKSHKTIC